MAWLSRLVRAVRNLAGRSRLQRELDQEIASYLDLLIEEKERSGLSPDDARREALREMGGVERVKEQVRDAWAGAVVETAARDVRLGARRLARSPGFTALAAGTLALGVGTVTAIFSVARPILFDPLPYPDAERLLSVADRASDGTPIDATFGTYRELTDRNRSLTSLAVRRPWQPTLTGAGEPERLTGGRVTAAYFSVLGVAPALGRDFSASEDVPGGPNVVVLSHALWRERFGADRTIVGRPIMLDDQPYVVIGVMGPAFEDALSSSSSVWAPLQYDATLPSFDGREWGHHLRMIARVRPGAAMEAAARDLDRIAADPLPEHPRPSWSALENGLAVEALGEAVTRAARPTLLAVVGAAALLLLIACVNVTHLLLGRGVQRRSELAMRRALGASRGRLVRQLLAESLLLALLGGAGGVALASLGVRALLTLAPPELPRGAAAGMDATALALALAITTAVGLGVGLVPALAGSRRSSESHLREASRRSTGGHRIARGSLVVAEVSLTLVLLVGAGLLLRSLDRLFAIDPGLEPHGLLTLQVQASAARFADDGATHRFFAEALSAVRSVPGVAGAALTSQLPLSGEVDAYGVFTESDAAMGADADWSAYRYAVSPGYFEAAGVPVLRGRALDSADKPGSPPVVVVSETLASRRFPGRDPLGERLHMGSRDVPWFTVVGVVGDVAQVSLSEERAGAVYVLAEQWYFADRARWLVVRTRGEPAALLPALREAIWSVDPNQPIVRVAEMEDVVAASATDRRFALRVFQAFGLAALILAAIGLYGVLAGGVSERLREMGVRTALGATRANLLALVLRQGMTLTGLGVLVGLAGAVTMSRALDTLLFGVSHLDPTTYVGVSLLIGGIAALASAVPAWRAARVDPATTLRIE